MNSNNLVCDIIDFINKNINDKITIDDLTYEFNYNRYYLMKLFKKELNISIISYINYKRIYNSLSSLRDDKLVLNVALNNGFYSQEYYTLPKKEEEDIFITNLINLENTIDKANNYIRRRKTDNKVKSIFN